MTAGVYHHVYKDIWSPYINEELACVHAVSFLIEVAGVYKLFIVRSLMLADLLLAKS